MPSSELGFSHPSEHEINKNRAYFQQQRKQKFISNPEVDVIVATLISQAGINRVRKMNMSRDRLSIKLWDTEWGTVLMDSYRSIYVKYKWANILTIKTEIVLQWLTVVLYVSSLVNSLLMPKSATLQTMLSSTRIFLAARSCQKTHFQHEMKLLLSRSFYQNN